MGRSAEEEGRGSSICRPRKSKMGGYSICRLRRSRVGKIIRRTPSASRKPPPASKTPPIFEEPPRFQSDIRTYLWNRRSKEDASKTPSCAFFSPMIANSLPTRSSYVPVLATLAPDKSALAYPIFVPHCLGAKRAELFIESRHARLGVEPRALWRDQSRHKCAPDAAEEKRIPARPVAFISVIIGAIRVEHLRAISKTLCKLPTPDPSHAQDRRAASTGLLRMSTSPARPTAVGLATKKDEGEELSSVAALTRPLTSSQPTEKAQRHYGQQQTQQSP